MWNTMRYRCMNGIMVVTVILGNALITKRIEVGIMTSLALLLIRKDTSLFRYMPISGKDYILIYLILTVVCIGGLKLIGVNDLGYGTFLILLLQMAILSPVKKEKPSYSVMDLGLIIAAFAGMGITGLIAPEFFFWVVFVGIIVINWVHK